MNGPAHNLAAMDWEQVDPLLRRKVIHGERMTVTRYHFEGGGRFPHHTHPQEQISYVLSGDVTFIVDDAIYPLGAGELIDIPPGSPHSAEAGPGGAEVMSVVSPSRRDGEGIELIDVPGEDG